MKEAVNEAGIRADPLNYINVHATSTGVGDLSELKAITRLLDDQFGNLRISATKSMTGHLLGAAGAIEAIARVLAVKNNKIPPTINTQQLDNAVPKPLDLRLRQAVNERVHFALSNSFGFGGHCAAVLLKKY